MADWTTLSNGAVGVGGLPSGTTVTALRDNPVAIAEGADGAPRVLGSALQFNLLAEATITAGVSSFAITDLEPHLGIMVWTDSTDSIWNIQISPDNGSSWTTVNQGTSPFGFGSNFLVWSLGHGNRTGRITAGLGEGNSGIEYSTSNGILANAVRITLLSGNFTNGTLKVYGFWRGWD